jgi:hypothetical protein
MHTKILKPEQKQILPLLHLFSKDFYLVGGTAIALHIGHRYSIDFDLFTRKVLKRKSIKSVLEKNNYHIQHILFEDTIQLHCIINNVKVTFFEFPFDIQARFDLDKIIRLSDLLTLAAMKAFALGGRAKWKDYVDLYFVFKYHHSLFEVIEHANILFKNAFNEKLFRQQLVYFEDISFEEEVEYVATPINKNEIKDFLTEIALTQF